MYLDNKSKNIQKVNLNKIHEGHLKYPEVRITTPTVKTLVTSYRKMSQRNIVRSLDLLSNRKIKRC